MLAHNISLHLGNYRSLYPYSISPDCFWLRADAGYTLVQASYTPPSASGWGGYAPEGYVGLPGVYPLFQETSTSVSHRWFSTDSTGSPQSGPEKITAVFRPYPSSPRYALLRDSGATVNLVIDCVTGTLYDLAAATTLKKSITASGGSWIVELHSLSTSIVKWIASSLNAGGAYNFLGNGSAFYCDSWACRQDRVSKLVDQNPLHTSPAEWTQATPASQPFWQNQDSALCVGAQLWTGKAALWNPNAAALTLTGTAASLCSGAVSVTLLASYNIAASRYFMQFGSTNRRIYMASDRLAFYDGSTFYTPSTPVLTANTPFAATMMYDGGSVCSVRIGGVTYSVAGSLGSGGSSVVILLYGMATRELVLSPSLITDAQADLTQAGMLARAA